MVYHDAYQIYELLDKWNHQGPPNVEDMNRLFESKSNEVQRRFLYGQTLLHRAVESFPTHTDVVLCIFEAFPQALQIEDDNGFLVLHRLLFSGNWYKSHEIMALVPQFVESFTESVILPTPTGRLPLHLACQRTESEELVRYLLQSFPDACCYRDEDGKFPLDHALEVVEPRASIVEILVKQHPVLLSYQDSQGCLPIQRLLKDKSRQPSRRPSRLDTVIKVLLEGFEGSLRLQDREGRTPLLLACTLNCPLSTVYLLLRQWPEQITPNSAATIFDNERFNGELIHSSLASKSVTFQNVQLWLQRYPDIVTSPDGYGRLPIHYAVASPSDEASEIVKYLLDFDNASRKTHQLAAVDNDGMLPIHIAAAATSTNSNHILLLLMDEYPGGLLIANKDGRLPWHYGECSRQDIVFEETTRRFPDVEVDLELVPDEIRFDFLA
ncbi:ankyrin repeat domain protein [Nitzschia inconspicua]|uniref:Ankyrin repeat domain protein n=1 Tax=Nitzschia inconspicua TaxID=303405 RepID=A0A9K3LZF2_9STRA|nr:ankyrin repeat domain protein [Nitzschia inconspicua]